MGNNSQTESKERKHIEINHSDRTGAYMNYWTVGIGEYQKNLIDTSLKDKLISECDALIQDKSKLNYRNTELTNKYSFSNMQIQDIIEPCNVATIESLFNITEDNQLEPLNENYHMADFAPGIKNENIEQPTFSAINKWIPSTFKLNKKTKQYELINEIVDIPKTKQFESLYQVIQQIFTKMAPNIQRTLNSYPMTSNSYSVDNWKRNPKSDAKFTHKLQGLKCGTLADEYNVIIKITDYQFMDVTKGAYIGGNWHSEGFDEEYIKAVGLYYFDITSNVSGGSLTFKTFEYAHFGGAASPEIEINDNMNVFFTNKKPYKHKVNALKMTTCGEKIKGMFDKNGNEIFGTRKVLGFFVVDNEKRKDVITTSDVIVNFQYKVKYVIKYWVMMLEIMDVRHVAQDVIDVIVNYVVGDMKYRKERCDAFRAKRYKFGVDRAQWEQQEYNRVKESWSGVCD